MCKDKLINLKDFNFPRLVRRVILDMVTGKIYAELHFLLKYMRDDSGELIEKLIPFG